MVSPTNDVTVIFAVFTPEWLRVLDICMWCNHRCSGWIWWVCDASLVSSSLFGWRRCGRLMTEWRQFFSMKFIQFGWYYSRSDILVIRWHMLSLHGYWFTWWILRLLQICVPFLSNKVIELKYDYEKFHRMVVDSIWWLLHHDWLLMTAYPI